MTRKIAFVHTSPAAIPPLMQYYGAEAPEFEIANLLEDGVLRMFSAGDYERAERRLGEMIATARDVYGAELAMITCSAVPRGVMDRLKSCARIPLIKIDDPMAAKAVRAGRRIGVAVTFRPTLEPTLRLLEGAARDAGAQVEWVPAVVPGAYDALLAGDAGRHDALLLGAIDEMAAGGVDAIVLAQVSMARVLPKITAGVRVFSSLPASLEAVRAALG
jgi:aspartate/glutamate racemase